MNDDEIQAALERMGSEPVEPPRDTYAATLEDRLRDLHAQQGLPSPARLDHQHDPRGAGPRVAAVAAAILLTAGVAATIAVVTRDAPATVLELLEATDARVVLPDGSIVPATPGLELPDGAVVITGADGHAQVDGLDLPPDSMVVVEDGRARRVTQTGSPTPTTEDVSGSTTTSARPTSTAPARPQPPTTTPTTRPPPGTTTTTVRPPAAGLSLQATRKDRRTVDLRWSVYGGPAFARYLVVRTVSSGTGEPADPDLQARAVFSTTSVQVQVFRDLLPEGSVKAAYRVLVLDPANRVVGASRITRV